MYSEEARPDRALGRGSVIFLLVMFLGYAVYAADRLVLASVLVKLVSALGLTNIQQGLLVSAQYIGVLAVVFTAGHLSDRFGKWKIIFAGVAVFSLFTWTIGLAANFYQAFAFRLLSGLGEGIFWPVAMSAVANYFGQRKGAALGAFYVGFDVGGAGGSAIGGATYAMTSDWRTAFFVTPLLGIAVLGGLLAARRRFSAADSRAGRLTLGRDALLLLKRREVAVIMLFAFLATYPVAVWQNYFPTYFSSTYGASTPSAAFGFALILATGAAGKLVLGWVSDVVRRDLLLVLCSAGSLTLSVVFFSAASAYEGLLVGLGVGFLSSALFPIMQALASDSCDGKTGTALGLTTTFQSLATVLSPTITAVFFSLGVGKSISYNVLIPLALVVLVTLLLRDPRKRGG